jgi:ribonuclease E
MTFTEAALEVLRRSGKPLHYKQIAQEAIAAGLLSHVGQTPEETMGARLLAMAGSEQDRAVLAVDTGTFGLVEWGLPSAAPVLEVPDAAIEDERPYRGRERHPPMGEEMTPGGRREDRRRARDEGDDGRRKKRYAPPSEVAHAWLREHGQPLTLEALAKALREKDRIAEALERDLGSFEKALREENRRRESARRTPVFEFLDGGLVRGLEIPKESKEPQGRRAEKTAESRPPAPREEFRPVAFDEQRRLVLRTVRRRVASLDLAALERLAVATLEAQGFRELQMARRTKEGPIYLARRKWGASEWRFVVRVLKPGRDVGRPEVQELRKEVGHFSAQTGIVFGAAECSREAKSEANSAQLSPVMLYGAEAWAESLLDAGLGARKRLVEWFEYDDAFFASIGAGEEPPDLPPMTDVLEPIAVSGEETGEPEEKPRRGRDRERRRGRRDEQAADRTGNAPPVAAPASADSAPTTELEATLPASAPADDSSVAPTVVVGPTESAEAVQAAHAVDVAATTAATPDEPESETVVDAPPDGSGAQA